MNMIKVYTLSTCPWCKKLKQYLNDNDIPYSAVDVDLLSGKEKEDALAEVDKVAGKRAFPITVVKEVVVLGFKPDEIKEALSGEE
jgi:glutaredoxin-like protein NrdH